jgi:hypothetical protein
MALSAGATEDIERFEHVGSEELAGEAIAATCRRAWPEVWSG